MKKYGIGFLLIALLSALLLLSACGSGDGTSDENNPEFVYVPTYYTIENTEDVDGSSLYNAFYYDGMIYFSSYGIVGYQEPNPADVEANGGVVEDWMTDIYGTILCKMNVDGTGLTQLGNYLPLAIPEGKEGYAGLNLMTMDTGGNLWVVEYLSTYETDSDGNWLSGTENYYLRKLDNTGAELSQVDLSPFSQSAEYFYVSALAIDSNSNLYLATDTSIYVLDANGNTLFDLSIETWINGLFRMADGQVCAMVGNENGRTSAKVIDLTTKAFGKAYEMPYNTYSFYAGGGDYALYCTDNSYFYGVETESGEVEQLLNWISSDIDQGNLQTVIPLEDGRILCVTYSWESESAQQELVMLTKVPYDEVEYKTVLTMATVYMNYELRAAVINFNKTNPSYRIEVVDYSQYNTEEDYTAGLTKLNTEIISGNIPDLLDTSQLPMKQYVAKGLLEDLYSYIDSDSEYNRDTLMTQVLQAMEIDGCLYQVSPRFNLMTVVGASSMLGNEPGWTFAELKEFMREYPDAIYFGSYFTQRDILMYAYMFNESQYVDWQKGECRFDSDEFIGLLEFAATFPSEYNWEEMEEDDWADWVDDYTLIQNGQMLLSFLTLYDFGDYQIYDTLYDGDAVFIGFPSAEGCGSVISTDLGLAMTTKCKDKEAAWSFMRTLLSEEYQKDDLYWSFPTNKACFEEKVENAMNPENMDENGRLLDVGYNSIITSDGTEIQVGSLTEKQYEKFMDLLDRIDSTRSYDENIYNIVQEEAAAFFAGQKSAADTAAVIQSRVNIYVNEQR